MKMHTPLFIVGLLTFVTPSLGLPSFFETILISAYGVAIMLLVSSCNKFAQKDLQHEKSNVAPINESNPQI